MFIEIMFLCLTLYIFLWPKGSLTIKTYEFTSKQKLTFANKIFCFIPIYNTYLIRKELFQGGLTSLIICYAFGAINILNLVIRTTMQQFEVLQLVSTAFVVISLLAWYITEVILMFQMTLLFSGGWKLITVIIPAFTAALITPIVAKRLKENKHNLEGTFDGKKKRRNNRDSVQT